MNRTLRHMALGASTGVTLFAIVVPPIHLLAALAPAAGLEIGAWDNPVGVFVFIMTSAMVGVFPWGIWILLTDARRGEVFDESSAVAEYLLLAIGAFLTLTLLVCTRFQSFYEQYRWFLTPALFVCAVALICWRWSRLWRFPTRIGVRDILDHALALRNGS